MIEDNSIKNISNNLFLVYTREISLLCFFVLKNKRKERDKLKEENEIICGLYPRVPL